MVEMRTRLRIALRTLARVGLSIQRHTRGAILAGVGVTRIGFNLAILAFEESFAFTCVKVVSNLLTHPTVLARVRVAAINGRFFTRLTVPIRRACAGK